MSDTFPDVRLRLQVPGRPVPQGSMRAIRTDRGGRMRVIHDSPKLMRWRTAIAWAARGEHVRFDSCPIAARLTFTVPRPGRHYDTTGRLRQSAPSWPTSRSAGDLDKLIRAVLDALTDADAIGDDAYVMSVEADKRYADPTHAPGLSAELRRLA